MSSSAERARERRRERDLERREAAGDRERRLERERERSRVRRSAESPLARERLERDRERRAAEFPGDSAARLTRFIGLAMATLAAHNTCTHAQPRPDPRAAYVYRGARPPPSGSKVLPVEEGSGAWGRPWCRTFAIAKGQGRRRPGYKGLGTR